MRHRRRNRALRSIGSGSDASVRELDAILARQGGRCALSGAPVAWETGEVDHRVPRARGGHKHASNLQWLARDVNQAKGAMSEAAFVALCYRVVAHDQRKRAARGEPLVFSLAAVLDANAPAPANDNATSAASNAREGTSQSA